MIISKKLINQYLSEGISTEALIKAIERTEIEIEEVVETAKLDPKIVAGKILSVKKHPNADRLQLARVQVGKGQILEIVCGAPNIAKNQRVPVATVGAKLPNGMLIEKSKIRGVESQGMLCSEVELGLSNDHSGIYLLAPSTTLGLTLCDIVSNDVKLDIKTPANRSDLLSIVGISREISIYVGSSVSVKNLNIPENDYKTIEEQKVKKTGECTRLIVVRLRVKNDVKTPTWIVDNLEALGQRSISPVVDITNLVMFELGQPSHAYDAKKIKNNISIGSGSPALTLTTIDNVTRKLTHEDLIISDGTHPIGLAGVIGGKDTEVSAKTTEILLEVANFDKYAVRKTAQRHGIRTEASTRFEKGLPLPLAQLAANRIIDLLKNHCDAEVIDYPTDQLYAWPWVSHIGLRVRRAEKLLGVKIEQSEVAKKLQKLGYKVEHFSITRAAREQLGKPYVWGANFRENGTDAFDCSYLTDYLYSSIGVWIGHTAIEQYENGEAVQDADLRAGDLVFYSGHWKSKSFRKQRHDIGHVGIYIGKNKVIHARKYELVRNEWVETKNPVVEEVPLTHFVNNPEYKGARRYVDNFNHILAITVPWWRLDVRLEADITEEIIKIIGYDQLESKQLLLPPQNTQPHQTLPRLMQLRKDLVARGSFELVTYSFVSSAMVKNFGGNLADHLEIDNPKSIEQQYLRTNLAASIIEVINKNYSYSSSFSVFEISKITRKNPAEPSRGVDQIWHLGIAQIGEDAIFKLNAKLRNLGIKIDQKKANDVPNFLIGSRAAKLFNEKIEVGYFGQINPNVLARQAKKLTIAYAEIDLSPELAKNPKILAAIPPNYQYIARDISFSLPNTRLWNEVEMMFTTNAKIARYELIDSYQNDSKSPQSLTVRIRLDMGANPSASAIETEVGKITKGLRVKLDAKIR